MTRAKRKVAMKMIQERLKLLAGELSDSLISDVMEIITDDIRVNRISYKQKTSFEELLGIAKVALNIRLSCEEGCLKERRLS